MGPPNTSFADMLYAIPKVVKFVTPKSGPPGGPGIGTEHVDAPNEKRGPRFRPRWFHIGRICVL